MNKYFNTSIIILLTLLMGACGSLVPYKETSMCDGTTDIGKCIKITDAYNEAVSDFKNKYNPPLLKTNQTTKQKNIHQYVNDYHNARYQELSSLIKHNKTPLLKPATTYQILITAYPSEDKTIFYNSRTIYYIENSNQWLLDSMKPQNKKQTHALEVYQ